MLLILADFYPGGYKRRSLVPPSIPFGFYLDTISLVFAVEHKVDHLHTITNSDRQNTSTQLLNFCQKSQALFRSSRLFS